MAWGAARVAMALLGFEEEEAERKFSVSFDEGTFSSPSQAHVRHMEVVMHFLMIKACPGEAQAAFKLLWPIVDKAQGREFRKWVSDKLAAMQKEKLIPATPIVRSTIIENPGGTKFVAILNYLTQYVMKKQIKAMGTELFLPQFNKDHAQTLVDVMAHRVEKERARFLQHAASCAAENSRLEDFSSRMEESIKSLASEREDIRIRYEQLKADEHLGDIESLRREVELEAGTVRDLWNELQSGDVQVEGNRKNVTNMMIKDDKQLIIDLHCMSASSGYDMKHLGENPSIESVLQRWAASMSQLHKYLIRVPSAENGLHNLAALADNSQALSSVCKERLANIRSLKERLQEKIQGVEKSISSLQAEIYPGLQFPGFLDADESLSDEAEEECQEEIKSPSPNLELPEVKQTQGAGNIQNPERVPTAAVLSATAPVDIGEKHCLVEERRSLGSVSHHSSAIPEPPSVTIQTSPGCNPDAQQLQAAVGKENFSPVAKPSRIPSLLGRSGSGPEEGKATLVDTSGDSAIERRRAALRQKLQGTLNDDFLKP
eukprot:758176-Hanusia_phi.AAC.3